jgi:hypothetical protein
MFVSAILLPILSEYTVLSIISNFCDCYVGIYLNGRLTVRRRWYLFKWLIDCRDTLVLTCSRHDTDQNFLIYPETIITDSLTTF